MLTSISVLKSAIIVSTVGAVRPFTIMWSMYSLGWSRLQATAILIAVSSLSPVSTH